MQAIRVASFGGPDVLQFLKNVPIPKVEAKQVLIKVHAAGINPVDTYIRTGNFFIKPELPYIPGADCAGTVEKIGKGVTKIKVGQRVFGVWRNVTGTYAEYSVFPENAVFPLDEKLTFSQGAAIGVPYFTAFRALFQKGKACTSETVLVHGASGAVGLAAVQIAKSYGLKVIGTAGSDEGLKTVKGCGADFVVNHKDSAYLEKIMEFTNKQGVDVILEMLANVNLGNDLGLLRQQGRVMVVGCRGDVEINPRLLMQKESIIQGVTLVETTENEWAEIGNAIAEGTKSGALLPVIDKEYSLENAPQAHNDIINNTGARGKLVFKII